MSLLTSRQVKNLVPPQPKCQRRINLYFKNKAFFCSLYKTEQMLIAYAFRLKSQIQQILKIKSTQLKRPWGWGSSRFREALSSTGSVPSTAAQSQGCVVEVEWFPVLPSASASTTAAVGKPNDEENENKSFYYVACAINHVKLTSSISTSKAALDCSALLHLLVCSNLNFTVSE